MQKNLNHRLKTVNVEKLESRKQFHNGPIGVWGTGGHHEKGDDSDSK